MGKNKCLEDGAIRRFQCWMPFLTLCERPNLAASAHKQTSRLRPAGSVARPSLLFGSTAPLLRNGHPARRHAVRRIFNFGSKAVARKSAPSVFVARSGLAQKSRYVARHVRLHSRTLRCSFARLFGAGAVCGLIQIDRSLISEPGIG